LWEEEIMATRPPLPPFTHETTKQKVRLAEDGWNSRDLVKSGARLRAGFPLEKPLGVCQWQTRDLAFLTRKWNKELDYRLIKEL
jgi:nuclear transport factor 2 (NTF2) superfamily protein